MEEPRRVCLPPINKFEYLVIAYISCIQPMLIGSVPSCHVQGTQENRRHAACLWARGKKARTMPRGLRKPFPSKKYGRHIGAWFQAL